MALFSKATYKEVPLPFLSDCYSEDYPQSLEAGMIDIEACGIIDGVPRYFCVCYSLKDGTMYDNGDFEQLIGRLRDSQGRQVTVRLKYKKDRLVDFKILPESLAAAYHDDRFLQLECAAWGIKETSCRK